MGEDKWMDGREFEVREKIPESDEVLHNGFEEKKQLEQHLRECLPKLKYFN